MNNNSIPHEQIKENLKIRDITFSDIAAAKKVTSSHVGRVAQRKTYSLPVAQAICLALDKPLNVVFGDVDAYFNPGKRGRPNRSIRTAQVVKAIAAGVPVPDVQQAYV